MKSDTHPHTSAEQNGRNERNGQRGTCLDTIGVRTCRMVYHSETNLQSHPHLFSSCSDPYTLTYHQSNTCSIFHWTELCGRFVGGR